MAVAVAGDQDRAAQLGREITNPDTRAQTLSDLVLRIIRSSEKTVLRQNYEFFSLKGLLAEVIGTSSWLSALPAVAQLDPSALQAICDVLLDQNKPI